MSSYHSSFKYLDKKSDTDLGWIIAHFDPDNGETDSYLSQEQVYSDSYNGTKRTLYGTKYTSVANVKITVVKQDGSDFTLTECRNAYKWLTGNPEASWMDLYIGDEVKYRLLCTIQDVKPQKMDARTVGLNIYCESLSPWAYSPIQETTHSILNDGNNITIDCPSDDLYTYVYAKTTYINGSADAIVIQNNTTGDATEISKLSANEIVTLDGNMLITSDKPSKVFGNSFNFVWPRFKSGPNELVVTGDGTISFEYYYPIKMGDCAQNINIVRDPICDDFGNIQVDMLPWERISNTPTTMAGYGISSDIASKYYNKSEINSMLENFISDDVYTKTEIDEMLSDISVDNVYTKPEVDEKITTLESQIADLLYKDISITSFKNSVGIAEKGRVFESVTLTWATNKDPKEITISNNNFGSVNLNATSKSYTYNNISSNQTWNLAVTGERGERATSSTSISFLNRIYYGYAAEPSIYDSTYVMSLSNNPLSSKKVSSFTVTTGDGQYIYYCLPTSMGTCSFKVGGFTGGITLIDTVEFINEYDHPEMYYIYRSDYPNLGTREVLVS